jgi:WD40 repeat protein
MTDADEELPGRLVRVHVLTPGLKAVILLAIGALLLIPRGPEHAAAQRGVLGTHPSAIGTLAFSPDGETLAVGGSDGSVALWDVTARRCRVGLAAVPSPPCSLAFKPDLSAVVVVVPGMAVKVQDLTTGSTSHAVEVGACDCQAFGWSPDGRTLAVGQRDGSVVLLTPSGRRVVVWPRPLDRVTHVAFAPDGRSVAAADVNGAVAVWDRATGQRQAFFPANHNRVFHLTFAPGGRTLVAPSLYRPNLRLLNLETGREQAVDFRTSDRGRTLAFAPDGQTLATAGENGSIELRDTVRGPVRAVLKGHRGLVCALAFSPDGRRLASGGHDQAVRLWDVPAASYHP